VDYEIPKVKINIDNQEIEAEQGRMIIEVADEAGIVIPRFCYHKKLAVAANCRMCLVDVDNARKPTPACATPVTDGMVIRTKSALAIQYQKAVMEFLLINHPLDCPICDQGGECELQDMAMGHGKDVSRYTQGKHSVPNKDIGPLIETDLTRCIHCTRCVRFGLDVVGMKELGMTGRGEHSEIDTFLGGSVASELSGNMIDLCPVGALTSKPFKYSARAWEMQRLETVSPHDCMGSNLYAHVRRNDLMRVVPRENEALNEVWITDRDRFSYEAAGHPDRITKPMIKRDREWDEVEWEEAFEYITKHVFAIHKKEGGTVMGALAHPSSTVEEGFLLQKMMRNLGSHNIDHRMQVVDSKLHTAPGAYPGITCTLAELEGADCVLVLGSDIRMEHPIVHHRIRKAHLAGATVLTLNPSTFDARFDTTDCIVNVDEMLGALAAVIKACYTQNKALKPASGLKTLLTKAKATKATTALATALLKAQKIVVLSGNFVVSHTQASDLLTLQKALTELLSATGGVLTKGANSAGLHLAGVVPGHDHQKTYEGGKGASAMFDKALSAYFLLNCEPDIDGAQGKKAQDALEDAKLVVAINAFASENLKFYANVILPAATPFETSGTTVNALGEWQTVQGVAKPAGDAKPAWKILRVLASFLSQEGMDYASTTEIRACLQTELSKTSVAYTDDILPKTMSLDVSKSMVSATYTPIYAVDAMCRHALSLQATPLAKQCLQVCVGPKLAKALNLDEGCEALLQQDDASQTVPIHIDQGLADRTVLVPKGVDPTATMGNVYKSISLLRVSS
jgi:NADH-quinone oxidoreductase subunit G